MKIIKDNFKYIVIVILIIMFTISLVPKTFQNDTFYTISVGKQMIEHGIDSDEHFAWHEGLEYESPHWFFDYLNALIYNVFDLEGLYVFVCAISVIFMLVIYFNMVNKGINWLVAYIATMITTYFLRDFFTDRAQILSYLLLFIEVMIIENFLKKKSKLSAIALFIISILVANIHSGVWPMFFVLFLPYIGEYVYNKFSIREVVVSRLKREEKKLEKMKFAEGEGPNAKKEKLKLEIEHDREFLEKEKAREGKKIETFKNDNALWLILIMVICLASAFISVYPGLSFTWSLKTFAGTTMNYINEHLPLIVASSMPFVVISILTIAFFIFTDSKMKLSDAFLLMGLYIMALSSRRHLIFLVIFSSGIITKLIDDFLKKYGKEDIDKNLKRKIKNIFFVLLCIVVAAFTIYFFVKAKDDEFVPNNVYPVEATEWISQNLNIKRIKLYNHYDFGSYLLYKGIPVFIDSRADLYTKQFNKDIDVFNDFIDTNQGKMSYRELFEKYDITHAIVYKKSVENVYMAEDGLCNELYSDDTFVVYQYNGNTMK